MALKTFTINNGSANQALVTNGSGVLSFAAVGASAGQVIQVITATDSTVRTTTSGSYATGGNTLSVTITPSSASNKILVIVGCGTRAQSSTDGFYTIFRGATNLGSAAGMSQTSRDSADGGMSGYFGGIVLDSPSTTSATTYQVYMKKSGSNGCQVNYEDTFGSITALEIKG